jgi:hypothetical protein
MKQAISGAITNRKGTTKMTVKNKGKNGVQKRVPNPPESGLENPPKKRPKNDPRNTKNPIKLGNSGSEQAKNGASQRV